MSHRAAHVAAVLALVVSVPATHAQTRTQETQRASTRIGATQPLDPGNALAERAVWELDARDRLVAEIWHLTHEEMARAKVLLQGPRAAFSVQGLSPVEALGIHARTDAERRKYAELFARLFHDDVKRSLAWNAAYEQAIQRIAGSTPVISYDGLPKVQASIGAADALGVPRSQLIEAGASGPSSRSRFAPALPGAPGR
jgi:hypothetical protein